MDALTPYFEERIHIWITQTWPKKFRTKKRRIANNEFRRGPLWLLGVLGIGQVEDRIAAFDAFDRLQDGIVGDVEAVVAHPLEIADPDDDLRQLLGEGIDLDAVELRRPHARLKLQVVVGGER